MLANFEIPTINDMKLVLWKHNLGAKFYRKVLLKTGSNGKNLL